MREKILVVSDLKKKNSAHSAMSELLSKSNAASTGKNETIKRAVPSGRIYRQPAARPQQAQTPVLAPMRQTSKRTNNSRICQKTDMHQSQISRAAGKSSSAFPRATGRRAVKTSFKVVRAAAATVVLLCLCTGIISAVLIMNPGQTDEMAIDTAIGVRTVVTEAAAETDMQAAQAEPALQKTAEPVLQNSADRFTVTFTFYDRESLTCTSSGKTVGALVELLELELTDAQRNNINMEATIEADTTVSVDAVTYDTVAVNTAIPYETKYVDVQTIPKGSTQTHQKGANGTQTAEYQVTYVNGSGTGAGE